MSLLYKHTSRETRTDSVYEYKTRIRYLEKAAATQKRVARAVTVFRENHK